MSRRMPARVCLVTTGQPATNPRAVKEADALSAAGYDVHMIGAVVTDWAVEAEPALMKSRRWSLDMIDWRREVHPQTFWQSGVRQRAALGAGALAGRSLALAERAIARSAVELRHRALAWRADLYIAHNLGALPAVVRAAGKYGARAGFDAEDFHSGQLGPDVSESLRAATRAVESAYLPRCDYVTASSPGVADAYAPVFGRRPQVVLNVMSRAERRTVGTRVRTASDPFRLYWFSQTIGPERGLEDVVQAMATLPLQVELHLRGRWAAGYEAELRRLANRCGVSAARLVPHPPAPPDTMVDGAARFDLGLALEPGQTANSRVAISNKIFTYLMAGLPVVATRTPGQKWFFDQAPNVGWMYQAGDAQGLSVILRRCVEDSAALAATSHHAADAAARRYCWEIEQDAFLETVSQVIDHAEVSTACAPAPAGAFQPGRSL
jgi:glycosyltransferase involved in cell wall biosynthesis